MNITFILIPLLFAGLIRVFVDKYKFLSYPIDFNFKINNKPVFGKNKTWGGFIIMTLVAGILGYLIVLLKLLNIDPKYGIILSIGYNTGELLNSFVKRQIGMAAGKYSKSHSYILAIQYMIDQIDGILFAGIFFFVFLDKSLILATSGFLIGTFLHFAVDILNNFAGSKVATDKKPIICFYQILLYILFKPFSLLIKINSSKLKLLFSSREHTHIISSNHVSLLDWLIVLESLTWSEFNNFAPFCYLVDQKFYKSPIQLPLRITGAVCNTWQNYLDDRPIGNIQNRLNEGYNLLIFFEGKRTKFKLKSENLKRGLYSTIIHQDKLNKILYLHLVNISPIPHISANWKLSINSKDLDLNNRYIFNDFINKTTYDN
jgi:1-acyl-sn-glycerol-3-phosphate acyltransferase